MRKIIKLTEKNISRIVKKILREQTENINPNNLKFGDRDKSNDQNQPVRQLQQRLIDKGFLILRNGPTGYFGNLTQIALNRALGKKTSTTKTTTPQDKNLNKPQQKQKTTPQPQAENYLFYDGKILKFIINGNVVKQWNAWSGRTKWNADTPYQKQLAQYMSKIEFMKMKDQGPIPEGVYYISQIQARSKGNSLQFCGNKDWVELYKIYRDEFEKYGDKHQFNTGYAQDLIAWGNYRLPITPKPGTNTFNRGSFYLHGGGYAGSIGCIDLVDKIDDFVNIYKDYLNKKNVKTLDLYVNYSGKLKTPGSPAPLGIPKNIGTPENEPMIDTDSLMYKKQI